MQERLALDLELAHDERQHSELGDHGNEWQGADAPCTDVLLARFDCECRCQINFLLPSRDRAAGDDAWYPGVSDR